LKRDGMSRAEITIGFSASAPNGHRSRCNGSCRHNDSSYGSHTWRNHSPLRDVPSRPICRRQSIRTCSTAARMQNHLPYSSPQSLGRENFAQQEGQQGNFPKCRPETLAVKGKSRRLPSLKAFRALLSKIWHCSTGWITI